MNGGSSIWDKLTRLALFLLLLAALLFVMVWYRPVIEKNERLRKANLQLQQRIEKEIETSKKLDASIRALQDPKTVERLARERLSYAKPGEHVIHFEPPATNSPSPQP